MLGITGVPLWSGFLSKTLLHESLKEYIGLLQGGAWMYTAAEWLFILSGGLTVAYMLKLYVCLFWEHPETMPEKTSYLSPASAVMLCVLAAAPLLMGVFPSVFMDGVGHIGADFLYAQAHTVAYFDGKNLPGRGRIDSRRIVFLFPHRTRSAERGKRRAAAAT